MLFSWVLSLRKSPSYVEELLRARIIQVQCKSLPSWANPVGQQPLLLSELLFHTQ